MAETYPVRAMARSRDNAAFAANWRQVIAADAAVGAAAIVAGLVVMFAVSSVPIGAGLAALGVMYVAAVGRRALRWRRLRAEAGL
jgi:hypothetical protein